MDMAIEAEGLVKHYGRTVALDGVSLSVPRGAVLGVLGPNGAGKTTAVRVLTTQTSPDAGWARVLGTDVVDDPDRVRRTIGLAGQYAAVDERLTGRENLVMIGRLTRLGRAGAARRADELLERFSLTDAGDRVAKGYSGGMRRRLDLAASLVARPPVLFLDEPTTGLDPRSRVELWEVIGELVREGTTLLLTTQYLEEADRLADRIAVVDHGRVIAEGTSAELKQAVGTDVLAIDLADVATALRARDLVAELPTVAGVELDGDRVAIRLPDAAGALGPIAARLHERGITPRAVEVRRPTLDDAFLSLTGRPTDPTTPDEPAELAATAGA